MQSSMAAGCCSESVRAAITAGRSVSSTSRGSRARPCAWQWCGRRSRTRRDTVGAVRLVLYTGKGGVGKTTTAAAAAVVAAQRGLRTLVASADVAHSLGDVLDARLGPEPRQLAPHLFALEIDPRVESARHWGRIQRFLERTFRPR